MKAGGESYADGGVWDSRHRSLLGAGTDRDRSGEWLSPFLPSLVGGATLDVLDLGCGTGYDALELARRGFRVTAIDHSAVAIKQALKLAANKALNVNFQQGDVGKPLPYQDAAFDAVISNLVLHSFPDTTLRGIVGEIQRCLRLGGLLLFHANSTEDLARRTLHQPPERQVAPNLFVLAGGQSMHFFSHDYCRDLLRGWTVLDLQPVSSSDSEGRIIKSVWRCIAQKPR